MALRRHDLCGPRPPPKASHLKPGVHRNREERLFRVLLAPFERVELRSTRVHAARGGSDARPSARRRYARPEEAIDFGRHCLTSEDKRRTRRVVERGVAGRASTSGISSSEESGSETRAHARSSSSSRSAVVVKKSPASQAARMRSSPWIEEDLQFGLSGMDL